MYDHSYPMNGHNVNVALKVVDWLGGQRMLGKLQERKENTRKYLEHAKADSEVQQRQEIERVHHALALTSDTVPSLRIAG